MIFLKQFWIPDCSTCYNKELSLKYAKTIYKQYFREDPSLNSFI